jgi:hypothetical protein
MKSNKGYYVSLETFISLDHPSKTYYIPSKKEWEWTHLKMKYGPTLMVLKNRLTTVLKKSKSHVWQKNKDSIQLFFIVW